VGESITLSVSGKDYQPSDIAIRADLVLAERNREGKRVAPKGIFCTVGHHRSVVIAENVGCLLRDSEAQVNLEHHDRDRQVASNMSGSGPSRDVASGALLTVERQATRWWAMPPEVIFLKIAKASECIFHIDLTLFRHRLHTQSALLFTSNESMCSYPCLGK